MELKFDDISAEMYSPTYAQILKDHGEIQFFQLDEDRFEKDGPPPEIQEGCEYDIQSFAEARCYIELETNSDNEWENLFKIEITFKGWEDPMKVKYDSRIEDDAEEAEEKPVTVRFTLDRQELIYLSKFIDAYLLTEK
jgi:hypothetical protein